MPAAIDLRLADPMLLALAAKRLDLKKKAGNSNTKNIPQTADELWNYVAKTWGVEIPRTQICPNHSSPFQAFADAYFARDSMVVWEASRGLGGKSFLLSLLGLTIACTRGGDVNILGGSGEQARRVHEYMAKAWDAVNAPRSMLRSDPLTMITRLSKGNKIQALLASSASVRGPHTPTLLLDEVDEMDIKIFDASMGQTMGKDGCPAVTVLSSTHHYPDGTMTEVKKRAKDKGWLRCTPLSRQFETEIKIKFCAYTLGGFRDWWKPNALCCPPQYTAAGVW
jgi:hypothetical protein